MLDYRKYCTNRQLLLSLFAVQILGEAQVAVHHGTDVHGEGYPDIVIPTDRTSACVRPGCACTYIGQIHSTVGQTGPAEGDYITLFIYD